MAADIQFKIGVRLRHARKVKGLRLRDVAERAGCSESLLSKVENEKVNPSLRMLHRIVSELDMTIADLMSHGTGDNTVVLKAGKRPVIRMTPSRETEGTEIEWLVPRPDIRLLEAALHTVNPGGGSLGTIQHEGEEMGFVLEGELELEVYGDVYRLKQGDSFFFHSDRPHGYRNPGKTVTRIVWVNSPPTF